jgi:hypothetical protein
MTPLLITHWWYFRILDKCVKDQTIGEHMVYQNILTQSCFLRLCFSTAMDRVGLGGFAAITLRIPS